MFSPHRPLLNLPRAARVLAASPSGEAAAAREAVRKRLQQPTRPHPCQLQQVSAQQAIKQHMPLCSDLRCRARPPQEKEGET